MNEFGYKFKVVKRGVASDIILDSIPITKKQKEWLLSAKKCYCLVLLFHRCV